MTKQSPSRTTKKTTSKKVTDFAPTKVALGVSTLGVLVIVIFAYLTAAASL